jgi:hypothetical protein
MLFALHEKGEAMTRKKWLILTGIFVVLFVLAGLIVRESFAASGDYKILAWNDLGMHCYSRDFADLAVLPPYNTLWVQVVKTGNPPELVTSGIRVEYSYADNTYSVGKTNFWRYDQALFGVNLPANVGLKGKGLSGTMDLSGDHFIAEGIPITEFSDSAPNVRQPYQLATVVVKDSTTGQVLTSTQVVTPTSSEMRCDKCHSDTGIAKPSVPTGKVETNILQLHDENAGTTLMANRPVLCATCHASNALGAPGKPGIKNLSKSMHEHHAGVIPSTLDGCYNCHPGPKTRCLRDVMSVEKGMICSSCHGSMSTVSNNPDPWLHEPRCDACHNSGRYNQDQALYRFSKAHGGLYCEACHDSTHAVAPSREANDAIKFNQLQGRNGPLEECSVCHTVIPSGEGVHDLTAPIISGNVGAADVKLSYMDGTAKTVISQTDGSYSFAVSYNWSGTVTPSKSGYIFIPAKRNYTNVTTNKAAQNYTATLTTVTSFKSAGTQDGWVLESSETSNQGGGINPTAATFILGDNTGNRQYRSILHFDTSSLPENAVIARVVLKIKKQSVIGTNPFTTHGKIAIDIRKGAFSNNATLQVTDFQAATSKPVIGWFTNNPTTGGWYVARLTAPAYPYINRTGSTQFRLRFQTDDDNDSVADFIRFYSGNSTANQPILVVEYYVP